MADAYKSVVSKLDELLEDVRLIKSDIAEIKLDVTTVKTDIVVLKDTITELRDDVSGLKFDVSTLQTEIQNVKTESQLAFTQSTTALNKVQSLEAQLKLLHRDHMILKHRVIDGETHERRENLIFLGVKQAQYENCATKIKNVLKDVLKLPPQLVDEMKFQRCHRLHSSLKPQPIICRFLWCQDHERVWAARQNLQNTNISLREHFPEEIERRRSTLFPILKRTRSLGHRATMVADRLIIDGNQYTVHTLNRLPPALDPALSATKRQNCVTCFFFHQGLSNLQLLQNKH